MLQAFVDDTGSDPHSRMFILAGFVATVPQWQTFRNEWQRVLDTPPTIAYYKNNQAYGLKGEFSGEKGWTIQKRDDKIAALVRVISSFVPQRFYVAVKNHDYKTYIMGIPVRNRRNIGETVYSFLFYQMIFHILGYQIFIGIQDKCEFVFDDQGKIGTRALHWWEMFNVLAKTRSKYDYKPYFAGPPSFKSDLVENPLQAADLYAGQIGRLLRSEHLIIPPSPALKLLDSIRGWGTTFDREYFKSMRAQLLTEAGIVEMQSPGSLRHTIGKMPKHR